MANLSHSQPAEWSPHDACWLAWPSHRDLWGADLAEARRAFVELCLTIADPDPVSGTSGGEHLEILVLDEHGELEAREALEGLSGLTLHRCPFGDIWLRDTGPIFVEDASGRIAAARFRFNGWGGKYILEGDEALGGRVADMAGVPSRQYELIAEGGALEVDGEGTCLTTRQCLLNENRNPGFDEEQVEVVLREALGVSKVVWLDEGLANDHTDGHIDNLARFVAPGKVACAVPSIGDPNRGVLEANRRRLEQAVDASGRRLEIVELPSPGAVLDSEGRPLPASYLNYYVANGTVAVPVFGKATDQHALKALSACFSNRRVVGIESKALLGGGGSLHCITQHQPSPRTSSNKTI